MDMGWGLGYYSSYTVNEESISKRSDQPCNMLTCRGKKVKDKELTIGLSTIKVLVIFTWAVSMELKSSLEWVQDKSTACSWRTLLSFAIKSKGDECGPNRIFFFLTWKK